MYMYIYIYICICICIYVCVSYFFLYLHLHFHLLASYLDQLFIKPNRIAPKLTLSIHVFMSTNPANCQSK